MLSITFTPPTTYTVGDQISGSITYALPDTKIWYLTYCIRLVVTITGYTEVRIGSHHAHTELLRLTVVDLYSSNISNTWPFRFPFPNLPVLGTDPESRSHTDTRDSASIQSHQTQSLQKIQKAYPMALPPSFTDISLPSKPAVSTSSAKDKVVFMQGTVTYTVTASINVQHPFGKPTALCSDSIPIIYVPRQGRGEFRLMKTWKGNSSAPMGKECTVWSSLLVPESEPGFEFKEKGKGNDQSAVRSDSSVKTYPGPLSRVWKKKKELQSQLPHFNFELFIVRPRFIHLGTTRTCLINILPAPKTSTTHAIPEFRCRRYRIRLIGQTTLFTPASLDNGKGKDHTSAIETVLLDINKEEGWDVLLSAENGYSTRIDVDIPPSDKAVPSFRAYNVERDYTLQVEVWIECLGEMFYLENKGSFHLLPPSDDRVPKGVLQKEEGDNLGDPPPAYPVKPHPEY